MILNPDCFGTRSKFSMTVESKLESAVLSLRGAALGNVAITFNITASGDSASTILTATTISRTPAERPSVGMNGSEVPTGQLFAKSFN